MVLIMALYVFCMNMKFWNSISWFVIATWIANRQNNENKKKMHWKKETARELTNECMNETKHSMQKDVKYIECGFAKRFRCNRNAITFSTLSWHIYWNSSVSHIYTRAGKRIPLNALDHEENKTKQNKNEVSFETEATFKRNERADSQWKLCAYGTQNCIE